MVDFYPHPGMADGYLSVCKTCKRAAVRRHRRTTPTVQAYDRDRAKTAKRRLHARALMVKYREENPDAYRAQTAVGNALRDGRLSREACLFCAVADHVHAHHRDYSKPLDVIWLCAKCHHRMHANFPESDRVRA